MMSHTALLNGADSSEGVRDKFQDQPFSKSQKAGCVQKILKYGLFENLNRRVGSPKKRMAKRVVGLHTFT